MTRDGRKKHTQARRKSDAEIDIRISQAVDAVCDELGIRDRRGRALIARRVAEAYARGRRQPLNLVDAGLGAAIASAPSCM